MEFAYATIAGLLASTVVGCITYFFGNRSSFSWQKVSIFVSTILFCAGFYYFNGTIDLMTLWLASFNIGCCPWLAVWFGSGETDRQKKMRQFVLVSVLVEVSFIAVYGFGLKYFYGQPNLMAFLLITIWQICGTIYILKDKEILPKLNLSLSYLLYAGLFVLPVYMYFTF